MLTHQFVVYPSIAVVNTHFRTYMWRCRISEGRRSFEYPRTINKRTLPVRISVSSSCAISRCHTRINVHLIWKPGVGSFFVLLHQFVVYTSIAVVNTHFRNNMWRCRMCEGRRSFEYPSTINKRTLPVRISVPSSYAISRCHTRINVHLI